MRDGSDSDEENEKPMPDSWSKSGGRTNDMGLGNHRRGATDHRGPPHGPHTTKVFDPERSTANTEKSTSRTLQYGANRNTLQNTAHAKFSRPALRSHDEVGARYKGK